jgi:DNA-binding CsgD family transcriptional regulator
MQGQNVLLTDRARALLLSFAISHNASDFCRFITVVAFREFGAVSSVLVRIEPDQTMRSVGNYGQPRLEDSSGSQEKHQRSVLAKAILSQEIIAVEQPEPAFDQSFIAIPFSPTGEVLGALGVTFRRSLNRKSIPEAELELLQLLSELIAVNSLPRMRASGLLSKLYFDSENLEDVSAITPRQLQVLDEMALGKTNSQIAKTLNMSESTIKQEAVRIYKILGVNSRQRAVSVGQEMGII